MIVLISAGLRITYYWDKIKAKTGTIDVSSNAELVLKTRETNIFKLDLTVSGTIDGTGTLIIGSDTTAIKTFDLTPGQVELQYNGDWYSEVCHVMFVSGSGKKGQLEIRADFIGD